MDTIAHIIKLEWQMFQNVQNQGGRAECQDNYETFRIMRSSQLNMWSEALRKCYEEDLETAVREGKNLLGYKYGYMMARTAPEAFAEIGCFLPVVDEKKQALVDEIVAIQLGQMEKLARDYPVFIRTARPIYKEQDTPWDTSFETYLWGELKTYSVKTLKVYRDFLSEEKGKNLIECVMSETARQYGYRCLRDAEEKLDLHG